MGLGFEPGMSDADSPGWEVKIGAAFTMENFTMEFPQRVAI